MEYYHELLKQYRIAVKEGRIDHNSAMVQLQQTYSVAKILTNI